MYDWRKMKPRERNQTLAGRRLAGRPWHSPPHRFRPGVTHYIVSAACYDHQCIIDQNADRMEAFSAEVLEVCDGGTKRLYAWCVLPNHYHLVVETGDVKGLLAALGRLHGGTSFAWNGEQGCRGRKVWHNAVEREIRSENHLWASVNYVHHNPVKHGFAKRWQDWRWSSAGSFLEEVGREKALELWERYPVLEYGKGWDW